MSYRVAWLLGLSVVASACKSDDLDFASQTTGDTTTTGIVPTSTTDPTTEGPSTTTTGTTVEPTSTTTDTTAPVDTTTTSTATFDPSTTTTGDTSTGSSDESTSSTSDTDTGTTDMTTGVVVLCPNGVIDPGEECDDDNDIDTDDCTNACLTAICGDGVVHAGVEECDDADQVDTNDCLNSCLVATCGDMVVHDGVEGCDDGNDINDDQCTNACVPADCGDGIIQAPEECDDQNADQTDDCLDVCTNAICGDGFIHTGFDTCDDGGFSPTCDDDCTPAMCGDGVTNPAADEDCDDSGETAQCDPDCTDSLCGDGLLNTSAGEICDDFGESDMCDFDCTLPLCGDGVLNMSFGEDCDEGGESAQCDDDCTVSECGDGNTNEAAGESCDDGNTLGGDGCSSTCQSQKIVFTTSVIYDGNLGGLAGADAKCQMHANMAGIPGTFKAWLSDTTNTAAARLNHATVPYVRVDGVKIADNWTDLTDGTLDDKPNKTEFGVAPPVGTASCPLDANNPDAGNVKGLTITATNPGGSLASAPPPFDFLPFHCSNWTTNSSQSLTGGGHWSSVDNRWTRLFCAYGCNNKESLYCIQQ